MFYAIQVRDLSRLLNTLNIFTFQEHFDSRNVSKGRTIVYEEEIRTHSTSKQAHNEARESRYNSATQRYPCMM